MNGLHQQSAHNSVHAMVVAHATFLGSLAPSESLQHRHRFCRGSLLGHTGLMYLRIKQLLKNKYHYPFFPRHQLSPMQSPINKMYHKTLHSEGSDQVGGVMDDYFHIHPGTLNGNIRVGYRLG